MLLFCKICFLSLRIQHSLWDANTNLIETTVKKSEINEYAVLFNFSTPAGNSVFSLYKIRNEAACIYVVYKAKSATWRKHLPCEGNKQGIFINLQCTCVYVTLLQCLSKFLQSTGGDMSLDWMYQGTTHEKYFVDKASVWLSCD